METFFTREHEWIKIDGSTGEIGITGYAAHQLGDITFIDLPKIGKEIKKGNVLCAIESVKAASDIYSPMSGKVIQINKILESKPEVINEKPDSEGWIARLELSDLSEKSGLMDLKQYEAYVNGL